MTEAETVVATVYGERYHEAPQDGARRAGVCGGFCEPHVVEFPYPEAEENGYSPCLNCYQCKEDGCEELQEFPHGPGEYCLIHGLEHFFSETEGGEA